MINQSARFILFAIAALLATTLSSLAFPEPRSDGKALGQKSLLIIRMKFADSITGPPSQADISAYMQYAKDKLQEFSQGALDVTWTSTAQVFTSSRNELDITEDQYMAEVMPEIRGLAKAAGYSVDSFDFVIFHKPARRNLDIGDAWAFLDGTEMTLGGDQAPPTDGESGVVTHELLHLFGLPHANLWEATSSDPDGPGSVSEYGERDDVMGAQYRLHCNAVAKRFLGWLSESAVGHVTVNGTFRVFRHDHALASGTRLLIVENAAGDDYYVDYRHSRFESAPPESLSIRKNGEEIVLLDAHPLTPGNDIDNYRDFGFEVNETFNDYNSGIKIKVLAAGGVSPNEYLDVRVTFNDHSLSVPSIYLAPQPITVIENDSGALLSVIGEGSNLSYQWYQGASGNESNAVTGGTTNILHVPPLIASTSFWVKLANLSGTLSSPSAQVTVELTDLPVLWLKEFKVTDYHTFSGSGTRAYIGEPNALICFDTKLKTETWRYTDTRYGAFYHPIEDLDGRVFAGHWDGSLNAFDQSTGSLLWSYNKSPWFVSRGGACIASDKVIFQRGIDIIALHRSDGTEAWVRQNGTTATKPFTDGQNVYWAVLDGSSPSVTGIDQATGSTKWIRTFPGDTMAADIYYAEGMTLAGGKIFVVLSRNGNDFLTALKPSDGSTVWQAPGFPSNSAWAAVPTMPVLDDSGNVYWINGQGNLIKLNGTSGSTMWQLNLGSVGTICGQIALLDNHTIGGLFIQWIDSLAESSFVEIDLNTQTIKNQWKVARRPSLGHAGIEWVGSDGVVYFSIDSVLYAIQPSGSSPTLSRSIALSGDLSFGGVLMGTSAQRTLTISTAGNASLSVTDINYPPGFSANWTSGVIPAGGSQQVLVTFTPSAAQSYSGPVTVSSNATSGIGTMSASGIGTVVPDGITRPDNLISLRNNHPVGNGVYNSTGAGQRKTRRVSRGTPAQAKVYIENDGTASEGVSIRGTAGTKRFKVQYFDANNVNITQAITAGTYSIAPLPPGAGNRGAIRVTVTPRARAILGSIFNAVVTSTSQSDVSVQDAVKFSVVVQ